MTAHKLKEPQSAHHQRHSSGDAVSKLFSQILIRHLEEAQIRVKEKDAHRLEDINVTELIKWEVWPNMMKIACKCYSISPTLLWLYIGVHMTTYLYINYTLCNLYIWQEQFCIQCQELMRGRSI